MAMALETTISYTSWRTLLRFASAIGTKSAIAFSIRRPLTSMKYRIKYIIANAAKVLSVAPSIAETLVVRKFPILSRFLSFNNWKPESFSRLLIKIMTFFLTSDEFSIANVILGEMRLMII